MYADSMLTFALAETLRSAARCPGLLARRTSTILRRARSGIIAFLMARRCLRGVLVVDHNVDGPGAATGRRRDALHADPRVAERACERSELARLVGQLDRELYRHVIPSPISSARASLGAATLGALGPVRRAECREEPPQALAAPALRLVGCVCVPSPARTDETK